VSITGDENIPINKRGSGVKRLILLNFFRAEAERRRTEENIPSIVYAIEEPETSQHSQHQKQLIKALIRLSEAANTQILLTTHSPVIVKELDFNHLKMVLRDGESKTVKSVEPSQLPYPSLNEVNFSAFNELTEEYHNELYGFIENEGQMDEYRNGKQTMAYNKVLRGGNTRVEQIILTDYIRHQIHHPENQNNMRFTAEELEISIKLMREFICNN
jgi:ABC-type glutathione transport system ATPase component